MFQYQYNPIYNTKSFFSDKHVELRPDQAEALRPPVDPDQGYQGAPKVSFRSV